LGKPSQSEPLFYHDLHKRNQPVGSLDAKILKNPIRICSHCNNAAARFRVGGNVGPIAVATIEGRTVGPVRAHLPKFDEAPDD
jgi:hypothetical protein